MNIRQKSIVDNVIFVGFPESHMHSLRNSNHFSNAPFASWNTLRDSRTYLDIKYFVYFVDSHTPIAMIHDFRRTHSHIACIGIADNPTIFTDHHASLPNMNMIDPSWNDQLLGDIVSDFISRSAPLIMDGDSSLQVIASRTKLIESLIQEVPNPVFFKDEDGIFRGCNREFIEMCGLPRERVIGYKNTDVFPTSTAARLDAIEAELLQDNTRNHHDLSITNRNRIEWDVHLVESVVDFMNKRGFLAVLVDLSQQKEVQQRLSIAIENARRANESRTLFLSHITHEIRTPINSMLGILTLLKDTVLDPVQEDYLNILQISGNALLTIINDLLDFSKIEAGKLEIEHQPMSIHTCVEEAFKVVDQNADEKRLELAYYINPATPRTINSDMERIRQILLNLLSNAIKFTTIGYVYVYVDSTVLPDGNIEVHFQVQDTGSGIEQENLEKIFMAFSQADSSIFKRHGGTGLGLTICRQLSELLGGRIWVESEVGKGSIFHFTVTTEKQIAKEPDPTKQLKQILHKKRLLGIGSDITMRKIIPLYTEYWGMDYQRIDYTMNQNEIRDLLNSSDAVIISVPLFGSRNLGLLHRIRLEYKRETLPVLILGTRNQMHAIRNDKSSEESFTIVKPLKERELYHALASAFHLEEIKDKFTNGNHIDNKRLAEQYPTRILVCDDNIFEQKIISNYLGKLGYHADITSTGEEALQVLRRHKYDLLIIDMNLPGRDGVEIAEEIKTTLPVEHQPRIVVSTSYDYIDIKDRLDRAGVDNYMGKPFSIEDLITVLTHTKFETIKDEKPMSQNRDELIDFERLEKELLPLEEEMVDVIGTYLDQVEVLISGMRNAYKDRNLADLNRFAHSLKSNSLSLGIVGIGMVSERIEHSSETDFDPEILKWIDTIEERFVDIRELLTNKYLK